MNKSQAVAELTAALSRTMATDDALALIRVALRACGLTYANTLTQQDVRALLGALASEGGPIQELAEFLATNGMGEGPRAA